MTKERPNSDSDITPTESRHRHISKTRFDIGAVGLGNIIAMIGMFVTTIMAFSNMKSSQAVMELRLTNIESSEKEMWSAIKELSSNNTHNSETQKSITDTLAWLVKAQISRDDQRADQRK